MITVGYYNQGAALRLGSFLSIGIIAFCHFTFLSLRDMVDAARKPIYF